MIDEVSSENITLKFSLRAYDNNNIIYCCYIFLLVSAGNALTRNPLQLNNVGKQQIDRITQVKYYSNHIWQTECINNSKLSATSQIIYCSSLFITLFELLNKFRWRLILVAFNIGKFLYHLRINSMSNIFNLIHTELTPQLVSNII